METEEQEKDFSLEKNYYKIGEVADMLGVATSTIRYWETEFQECRPARSASGRRLYTPKAIERLRAVRFLLRDRGMKVEAARQHLARNPKTVSRRLEILRELTLLREDLQGILASMEKRRD